MRAQVNFIARRKKGDTRKTKEFNSRTLRIGRATNQEIFLPDIRVAYEHAQIVEEAENAIYLEAKALSGVRINDEPAVSAALVPGTRIGVGSYEIRVREPSPDFDLILDVEQVQTEQANDQALLRNAKIDLASTGLSKRRWSWILFIATLLWFFVIPLVGSYIEPVQNVLKAVPGLPSNAVWNSGELAPAHHFFQNECRTCHQTPFIRVKNETCTECHRKTHQHADTAKFDGIENINEARCSSCHEEHNGTGILVRDDTLCSNCHAELSSLLGKDTSVMDVTDFGANHPEFRVSIPVVAAQSGAGGEVDPAGKLARVRLSDANNLKESHTLLFSHKAHLKPEGVRTLYVPKNPEGARIQEESGGERKILNCENCHVPDSGGFRMQPITFDRFCKDCHRLTFESVDKNRVLPHGEVEEVVFYLQQYYKSRALEGGFQDAGAPEVVRRRRPGREPLTQEEKREALQWAAEKARETADQVFMYRSCHTCHDVARGDITASSWTISPVRIPQHWMPMAVFNHAKHTTMECLDCHEAKNSENGADVLLTRIETCQTCHGGAHDRARLASTCIDCHKFHIGSELFVPDTRDRPVAAVEAKP
jgi:predicted CXXCH cytochrome family protein